MFVVVTVKNDDDPFLKSDEDQVKNEGVCVNKVLSHYNPMGATCI